jgi:hypothetical protein
VFNFNPKSPHAWRDAIERHQRGKGEALATMLASSMDVPAEARAYLATIARLSAKAPKGRPPATVGTKAYAVKLYRDRRIAAAFTAARPGESYQEAVAIVATIYRVSERTVSEVVSRLVEPHQGGGTPDEGKGVD